MSWQELVGKSVRVGNEVAEVLHVDAFRVVLQTEPQEGRASRRLVVSPDEPLDVGLSDEQSDQHEELP